MQIYGEMFTTAELIESVENSEFQITELGGDLKPADEIIMQAFYEELHDRSDKGDAEATLWTLNNKFEIMLIEAEEQEK